MTKNFTVKDYVVNERLGRGTFAIVYRARHKTTRQEVAIKAIKQKDVSANSLRYIEMEISAMQRTNHEYLLRCHDFIRTPSHAYLIMEYCPKGDLHTYLKDTYHSQGMPQHIVLHFLSQLASALKYMHGLDLIHRDIKPKNILLVQHDTNALPDIRLADFGFTKSLPKTSLTSSICGSPVYMAPEVYNGEKYNYKADLWSLGIVLHEMMTGHTLFRATNQVDLFHMMREYDDSIDLSSLKYEYTIELKDLVKVLLKKNPMYRASCESFSHYVKLIISKEDAQEAAEMSIIGDSVLGNGRGAQEDEVDDFVVVENEPPDMLPRDLSSVSNSLTPTIQRSHSVDYSKKGSPKLQRDRRHSAGSNGSMLNKAISLASFGLFRTSSESDRTLVSSTSSSTVTEDPASTSPIVRDLEGTKPMMKAHVLPSTCRLDSHLIFMAKAVANLAEQQQYKSVRDPNNKALENGVTALTSKLYFILNKAMKGTSRDQLHLNDADNFYWAKNMLDIYTKKLSQLDQANPIDKRIVQRLLYEEAVDLGKKAAVGQLINENLKSCFVRYQDATLLLEAILITPKDEKVKPKDVDIIKALIQSMKDRAEKIVL